MFILPLNEREPSLDTIKNWFEKFKDEAHDIFNVYMISLENLKGGNINSRLRTIVVNCNKDLELFQKYSIEIFSEIKKTENNQKIIEESILEMRSFIFDLKELLLKREKKKLKKLKGG